VQHHKSRHQRPVDPRVALWQSYYNHRMHDA
jgi:hypothetical protein